MSIKKEYGKLGETITCAHLEQQGFTVCARNFTQKCGEIDIIAKKNDLLVFVEVKFRTNNDIDLGELISFRQQQRIITTAKLFLAQNDNYIPYSYRFDVSLITVNSTQQNCITYIPDAFNAFE